MLSSVNISSVWLLTERWICLYGVWGRVLEKHQGFASVCLTQVGHLLQGQGAHHLPPLVSFHFTSLPSQCQEKLPFVSQVWQAERGKWHRERFGSFFFHQLAGDTRYPTVGEGCPKCPGDWRPGNKTPKSLFFCLVVSPFSVCCKSASAPERLEAQKRKAIRQTEKLYVQKKRVFLFPHVICHLFQTYRKDVTLSDTVTALLWCVTWCACVSKQFCTHHKHTLVLLRTLREKNPSITSLLWWGSVV